MARVRNFPDSSKQDEFLQWCASIEWATAAVRDSRDVLLDEVKRRAKELLESK
jgi:hypothetical protein